MQRNNEVIFKLMCISDLNLNLLRRFNRDQATHEVWFKEENKYIVKPDYFYETWDTLKKAHVVTDLKNCILFGGFVYGAFRNGQLVGFANVEGERFGSYNQYLELSYIHVSNENRNYGIGKKLFKLCCEKAKAEGAEKLYIAAHPSVETQHFYHSVGCNLAEEINQESYEKEPLDIQLECRLGPGTY